MIKTHCSFCNKQITVKTESYTGNNTCKKCKRTTNTKNNVEYTIIAGNTVVYQQTV